MKTLSDLRTEARQNLQNKWGVSAFFSFIYGVIYAFISCALSLVIYIGSIASSLILMPISFAYTVAFLRQRRGEEAQPGWLFQGFNTRIWYTTILTAVYTILWTLLLIIPGIIKSYSYAMTPYILHDEESLSGNAAIERSMQMMQGYKWRLFCLDLSFIGWYLLGILTLCIGWLWVVPYHYTARAAFYEELKSAEQACVTTPDESE